LAVQYGDGKVFTLAPRQKVGGDDSQLPSGNAAAKPSGDPGNYQYYFADIQSALRTALCARPETRPGDYSVGMELWVGPSGALKEFGLLTSTGDRNRDAALVEALGNMDIGQPPPADLPQPVTLAIVTGGAPECPAGAGGL